VVWEGERREAPPIPIPTQRDLDIMRSELNRQLEERNELLREYYELVDEMKRNGLRYEAVANPGWVPTRRDLDYMRMELNHKHAPQTPPSMPRDRGRLLDIFPFSPDLAEIYAREISQAHGYRDHGYFYFVTFPSPIIIFSCIIINSFTPDYYSGYSMQKRLRPAFSCVFH